MLTLFTIKKILFFGAIGTGVLGPIIGTSPVIREFTWGSSDISPLKEGIFDLANVTIYDNVSIPDFLKQALIFKEGQEGLVESFAQELAKKWYLSQPSNWTEEQRANWKELQKKQFEDAWKSINPKNHQRDFWDNYWGSRESMESFWLRHNSYKLVKSFLTEVKKSDFALSKSWEWHKSGGNGNNNGELFKRKVFVADSELEKPDSWKKIGFFPSKSRKHSEDEKWKKFIQGKFDFINWSYKKWFERTLPMYFWKVSWYYDKNATNSALEKEYNRKHLKEHFPLKANYSFPVFSEKTIEKFKSFINGFPQNGAGSSGSSGSASEQLDLEKYYIDNWKGDQSSPATLLEILNSFGTVTPEYASVASYLVNKALSGSATAGVGAGGAGQGSSTINELKSENIKSKNGELKDPISIFFDEGGGAGAKTNISFDSEILAKKTESSKKHKYVHDVRETDQGWVFFRDADGVHALALDGHKYLIKTSSTSGSTGEEAKNKLFNWFNFRNLQSSETRRNWSSGKKFLNLSESDNWFSKFSNYLNTNFDKLLAEYFFSDKNGSKELFALLKEKDKEYFNQYKKVLTKIFGLWKTNEWNSKIFGLRQKIIERYSSIDWKKKGYGDKNIEVVTKQGLSSPFPFETDFSDSKKERFTSQENVFNTFLKPKEQATQAVVAVKASAPSEASPEESPESDNSKQIIEYHKSVEELLKKNEINLKIRSNGFDFQSSQRLFLNDSIFDYLQDKLFANKDLLNYQVKEGKLLNSGFFQGNSLLKDKKDSNQNETNLPWLAPLNVEKNLSEFLKVPLKLTQANAQVPEGTQNDKCWECSSFQAGKDNAKNKGNLESLLNKLLKIYFFKNHLKTVKENYFDFLSDFPFGKRKGEASAVQQPQESQAPNTTKFNFLTDELFDKWRKSYLSDIKERNNFLDFLITLSYLSKKNFEGLREAMKVELVSSTDYHYLLFEAISKKTSEEENNKKLIHPFLSKKNGETGTITEQNFFENREKARQYIREGWRTIGKLSLSNSSTTPPTTTLITGETKDAIYKQLITEKSSLPSKTDKNNLFNFKNLKGLIERIKNISSPSDFDKLVTLISKVHTKVIPDFYRGDKLFTKDKKEKKIYLEEKKKLLVHQLLHTDEKAFYSSGEIAKENDILSKDIDKIAQEAKLGENSVTTAQVAVLASAGNGEGAQHHLKTEHFTREKGITKDGGYFIQVSHRDFEDESSTCEFFNLLPIDLLAEFLALEADKPLNKDKAQKSFFDGTSRVKARDMKFKSHVDSKHVE